MSSSMTSLISSAIFGGGSGSSHASGHTGDEGTIWLCKICAEQREMWKKSGAWFFKVSKLVNVYNFNIYRVRQNLKNRTSFENVFLTNKAIFLHAN